jgi:phosphotransferase system enzyme I (PtsI)
VEELRISRRDLSGPGDVERELKRFDRALEDTRRELRELARNVGDLIEGQQLVEVHMMLLDDPTIRRDVQDRIINDLVNAEYAVSQVLYEVLDRFRSMKDPYMRERAADVRDVGRRVMAQLIGTEREALMNLDHPVVLIGLDLDPSDTAGLDRSKVLAFATDKGGRTSHTAILARSLGIPAVVGLREAAEHVQPGQTVIVDGIHGTVIVEPDPDQMHYYRELQTRYRDTEENIARNATEPAVTEDGHKVELSANIEFSQEADQVRRYGGCGVGLFRTEFLKLLAPNSDDEDTQFSAYHHVLETLRPEPVIIRTFDLGGDKFLSELEVSERNPFLGYRAIRICRDRPELFEPQLRAILRASVYGSARLMIPMVTHVEQVVGLRRQLGRVADMLEEEGYQVDRDMEVGIMVETPAAALGIDLLLPYVDFVSLGTNDLTQYTLAVDRGSPYVADLFDPLHPTVLRQIDHVARACHRAGKWVGICGQMAGDPLGVPLLLGFELDELSVALTLIPDVKRMIRVMSMDGARDLAARALKMESARQVRRLVLDFVIDKYPEVLLDTVDNGDEED